MRGMKKMLLAALGLGAVLTSCGGEVSSYIPLTSNYSVSNLNFQGTNYSGPVVCDDRTTQLAFSFDYTGDINSVRVRLRGQSGAIKPIPASNVTGVDFRNGHATITFYATSEYVPLSIQIKPQRIVVSPKVSGATYIEVQGVDSFGNAVGSYIPSNMLPVVSNCS